MSCVCKTHVLNENVNKRFAFFSGKFFRRITRVVLGITIFVLLLLLALSPIAKYLIEKYDVEYTGREITLKNAYVNPFTGYVFLSEPVIYELGCDSVALSGEGISANVEILDLLKKTINIGVINIEKPNWYIVQEGSKRNLNFKDLIEKFSSDKKSDKKKSSMHVLIESIRIEDGTFYYYEDQTPVRYHIKDVNISSSAIGYQVDTIAFNYAFSAGVGSGTMKGIFTINVNNLRYRLNADIDKYNLQMFQQYLHGLSNYGSFRATLDARMRSKGSLKDARDLKFKGWLSINDMHFGKDSIEDYAAFKKLYLDIIALHPGNEKYIFDTIVLAEPYFRYQRYDHLDNFQTIFGKGGSRVTAVSNNSERFNLILEIASYVEKLSRNFFRSYYRINRLEIQRADFGYEDFSLNQKFAISTDTLYVEADSIDKRRSEVKLNLYTGIKPYGKISLNLTVNPQDSSNFDLKYHLEKIPLAMFNPYLVTYTSFPVNRGTLEANGNWKVRDGNINSSNHIVIVDPRIAGKVKNKSNKWLPLPLIMAIVKERGNVIDYSIPITGNLKNPKLHLKDVILDLLKNLVVNPVTTPYRIEVKNTETEIGRAHFLQWKTGQAVIERSQQKYIDKIAAFLEETPEAEITVSTNEFTDREKEYILFYEAKKKYYLSVNKIKSADYSDKDSVRVSRMSIRDSLFVKHLRKCCGKALTFTLHDMCKIYVGNKLVNQKFDELKTRRREAFAKAFKKNNAMKQVHFTEGNHEIPYNGFSYFRVSYKGEIPDYLSKAYRKMNELNNEEPRNNYKSNRRRSKFPG